MSLWRLAPTVSERGDGILGKVSKSTHHSQRRMAKRGECQDWAGSSSRGLQQPWPDSETCRPAPRRLDRIERWPSTVSRHPPGAQNPPQAGRDQKLGPLPVLAREP